MGFHSERHHRTSVGARIDVDRRAANCILAVRSPSSASERLLAGRQRAADVIAKDSRHALAVEVGLHVVCRSGRRTFQEAVPSIELVQLTSVLMEVGDIDATLGSWANHARSAHRSIRGEYMSNDTLELVREAYRNAVENGYDLTARVVKARLRPEARVPIRSWYERMAPKRPVHRIGASPRPKMIEKLSRQG